MDRPHALTDRVVADAARRTAAERARRATYLSRRAAAARRRAVLAVLLVLATGAGWIGFAMGAEIALAVAPTVLFGSVLVLGRRAVVCGRRADAAWTAGRASRVAADAAPVRVPPDAAPVRVPPVVEGRAAQPSDAKTEVIDRVVMVPPTVSADEVAHATTQSVTSPPIEGSGWTPVPVPLPAYNLKPAVPRPEPAPLPMGEADLVAEAHQGEDAGQMTDAHQGSRDRPAAEADHVVAPASGMRHVQDGRERSGSGSIDLDAVLARRRAVGE